jgi:hypothetical protein
MWLFPWCLHSQPKYDLYYMTLTEIISSAPNIKVPVEEQLAAQGDQGNVFILLSLIIYFRVLKNPVVAQTNSVNSYTLITAKWGFFNSASPIQAQIQYHYFELISYFCMRYTGPFAHLYCLHCSHEALHYITFPMLHLFLRFLSTYSSNHSILKHPHLCYYFTTRNNISVQHKAV